MSLSVSWRGRRAISAVIREIGRDPRDRVRVIEGRQAGAFQAAAQFVGKVAEGDDIEQRLRRAALRLERAGDLLGEQRLIEERAGRQNLDHRVDVRVLEQDLQHLMVQALEMCGGEVDITGRMADIGGGRQDRLQRRGGFIGERRHLDAGQFGNLVDAHRSRPAHVGEYGDAVTLRHRLHRERAQRVVELRDATHAHQSELAECAFVDRLGAGDRTGVGERCGRAQFAAAAFQHHHRLDRGGFAGRLEKAARIGQTFEIDADDARRLVVLQEGEQLGHLNVGHVAHGDIFVQAHPAARPRSKQK